MQVSGGVSSLESWVGVCRSVLVIKARALGESVQVSGGVSRLGSWVGVCRSVVVYQV